jgi:hypothetical protein
MDSTTFLLGKNKVKSLSVGQYVPVYILFSKELIVLETIGEEKNGT